MHLFISEFTLSQGWHAKWNASEIFWIHLPHPSGKEPVESTGRGGQHFEGDRANRLSITFKMTNLICYYRLGYSTSAAHHYPVASYYVPNPVGSEAKQCGAPRRAFSVVFSVILLL